MATYFVGSTSDVLTGSCVADDASSAPTCSIRLAIQEAEANPGADTIQIADGTYVLAQGSLDTSAGDDLSFLGNTADRSAVVIDGDNVTRVFDLFSGGTPVVVSFAGLTIRNGFADDSSGGGAINADGDTDLMIDNVLLQDNVAGIFMDPFGPNRRSSGGAIQTSGNLTITNSSLTGNSATQNGGAIHFVANAAGKTLTINDSTISGNSTGDPNLVQGTYTGIGYGGGLMLEGGTSATLTNVTISGNSAGDSGGGVYASQTPTTLNNSTFLNNAAEGSDSGGGGFYAANSSVTTDGGRFEGNTSVAGGAGLELLQSSGTIDATEFVSNQVTGSGVLFENGGGGLVLVDASANITNALFENNSAPAGGAIAGANSDVTIASSTITSNTATSPASGGGGIGVINDSATPRTLRITDSSVTGNTTVAEGGGIGAVDVTVELSSVAVSSNVASGGRAGGIGVVGIDETPTLIASGVTISDNQSNADGGGIAIAEAALDLVNVTISGNRSTNGSGGGIGFDSSALNADSQIRHSTIVNNTAPGVGSNIAAQGNPIDISLSIFAQGTGAALPGTFVSLGNNIDDGNSMDFSAPTDQNNTDPLLDPLADNGGSVLTHALLTGSPAIDAGLNTTVNVDARGIVRPQDGNGDTIAISDIGAFESEAIVMATLTIDDVRISESDGFATVSVRLDNPTATAFSVDVNSLDGTAIAGNDFTFTTNTLTFSGLAGEVQKFSININDDAVTEEDESFALTMSNVVGTTVTATDTATVRISDDDFSRVSFATTNAATVNEDDGQITVALTLSGATDNSFTVDVSFDNGTAAIDDDFLDFNQTVTFAGNDGEVQNITISIVDDTIAEIDEQFGVTIENLQAGRRDVAIDPAQARFGGTTTLSGVDLPFANPSPRSLIAEHGLLYTLTPSGFGAPASVGLEIYDYSGVDLTLVGTLPGPFNSNDVAILNNRLYTPTDIIDVSDPTAPVALTNNVFSLANSVDVVQRGTRTFTYVTSPTETFEVFDVTDPTTITRLGSFTGINDAAGAKVVGDLAYVAAGLEGIAVLDVSDPANITLVSLFDTGGSALDVDIVDSLAYVANGTEGILIADISDPALITEVGRRDSFSFAISQIEVQNDLAYVVEDGASVYSVADPTSPFPLAQQGSSPGDRASAVSADSPLFFSSHAGLGDDIRVSVPRLTAQQVIEIVDDDTAAGTTANDDSFNVDFNSVNNTLSVLANDTPNTLRITAVDSTNVQGTVSITPGGLDVSYTPAANFSGTETFAYTVQDPTGATATANVTVVVSAATANASIAGSVYVDSNSNGLRDVGETGIAGVQITLAGTDPGGNVLPPTTTNTDVAGDYLFSDLLAGTYSVTQVQPTGFLDGQESAGSGATATVGNDNFTNLQLSSGASAVDFNFGELAFPAGALTGHVACDLNANGMEESNERVIGTRVFLDTNGNRAFDPGEEFQLTDSGGDYSFAGPVDSSAIVVVEVPAACQAIASNPGVVRSTIAVGDLARSIASVDYDSDGDLDLVVASELSNTVSVLGNSSGEFSLLETIPLADRPQSVSAPMSSAFGVMAVAGVGTGGDRGAIYVQELDGNEPQRIEVGDGPIDVIVDDFDGDGEADIAAVSLRSNELSLLLSNTGEAITLPAPAQAKKIAAGDFNGDGNRDIVIAGFGYNASDTQSENQTAAGEFRILLGDGAGTFADAIVSVPITKLVDIEVGSLEQPLPSDPTGAVVDDQDLVYALSETGRVVAYRLDNGVLSLVAEGSVASGASSLEIASLNRDRPSDIVVANLGDQTIELLAGDGNGGFESIITIDNVDAPSDLVAADFNGDGFDEIAVSNLFTDVAPSSATGPDFKLPSTVTVLKLDVAESTLIVSGTPQSQIDFSFVASDPTMQLDVSRDGSITAIDALQVVNQISVQRSALESEDAQADGNSDGIVVRHQSDVDGDGQTTARDALMIINHLGRAPADARMDQDATALIWSTSSEDEEDTAWETAVDEAIGQLV